MTVPSREISPAAMDSLVAGLTKKADKIRALDKAGVARAAIAKHLGIRYQHVRNVLMRSVGVATRENFRGAKGPGARVSEKFAWSQIGPDGRVVVPAAFRQKLGLEGGDHVLMELDDGEVRLIGRDAAIARAQALVAKYVPEGVDLVEELLNERHREVEGEN